MKNILTTAAIAMMVTFSASAETTPGTGTNPGDQGQGFVSETVTVTEGSGVTMGYSGVEAPNDNAAASRGVFESTVTYKVDVNGPKGQVDGFVEDPTSDCNNCTISDPYDIQDGDSRVPGESQNMSDSSNAGGKD